MTADGPAGRLDRTCEIVAGHPVKLISSCVRRPDLLLDGDESLAGRHLSPRDGDLLLVRAVTGSGAYDHVEDTVGRAVKLYSGDVFAGILGTRRSGTNLMGELPRGPISAGDRLDLVAQGGLLAHCTAVPAYYGKAALSVEVLGAVARPAGVVVNLDDRPLIRLSTEVTDRPAGQVPMLCVCGTSAEVGKTTMVCRLNIEAKARWGGLRTAAIKACGTGRAKDCLHYRAANYDEVVDFVDAGLPSTYATPPGRYRSVLRALVEHAEERADLVVVEIGGDLMEAGAPQALDYLAERGAACVLLVNDAMGAMEGLRQLRARGCEPLAVATFKQNVLALAERLRMPPERVIDSGDPDAMSRILAQVMVQPAASLPGPEARPETLAQVRP
jgi:hypothetical protein